jgi:hypothetical protein
MLATLRVPALVAIGTLALAGCSGGMDLFGSSSSWSSSDVTTSAIAPAQGQKVDPACGNLALEIDTLRREGVADKVERAAAKKYTMKAADLTKANQLNKANAAYQEKCSTLPRAAAMPDTPPPAAAAATKAPAAPKAVPKTSSVPKSATTLASAQPQ